MSQEVHEGSFCFNLQRGDKVSPVGVTSKPVKVRPGRWLNIEHHESSRVKESCSSNGGFLPKVSCENADGIPLPIQYDVAGIAAYSTPQSLTNRKSHEKAKEEFDPGTSSVISKTDSELTKTLIDIGSAMSDKCEDAKGKPSNMHDRLLNGSQNSLQSVLAEDGGSVVFFIHGVGGSASLWHFQIKHFQEAGFEIVAPDLLGHGFSPTPRREAAYSFDELSKDCLALFDMYSRKRNILIGHSYGASFCTVIAKERHRKVTKMILISGGGPISLEPQRCHIFCLPSIILALLKPLLTKTFLRQAFHQPLPRVPAEHFSAFNVPSYVLRGTMLGQSWPAGDEEYHAAINVAVLLIYGLKDEFVTLEETEWMQETIYASTLETIPDAGHMVMLEFPDRVNQLIHRFIMKDMVVRHTESKKGKLGASEAMRKYSLSPLTRKKTMPNLMPGALQASLM